MSSPVFHLELGSADNPLAVAVSPQDVANIVQAVMRGREEGAGGPWALKVQVAPPGQPAWLQPEWVAAASGSLGCGPGSFCCETVSITTKGLEKPDLVRAEAERQGLLDCGLPFVVCNAEETEEPTTGSPASGLAAAKALAVLAPLRPHPHFGFYGALAELGLGLLPRAKKLALHRDIRPQVDTPLCAGCGSCLEVCLYDAIQIKAGRAFIDHNHCTGCGECMTVCFMAGISPAASASVGKFQQNVAAMAAKILSNFTEERIFINFLVGMERYRAGLGKRMSLALHQNQLVAGRDPVAVDQATWDLLQEACAGNLKNWHGYSQSPELLLTGARELGLGSRNYHLIAL